MVEQARSASDRIHEAERQRASAIQEAAYYRAKLAALEAASEGGVARLERERTAELERQLTVALSERAERERRAAELGDALAMQGALLAQAEARAQEASQHSEALEQAHVRTLRDHTEMQERHEDVEAALRAHADRLLAQSSALEQKEADLAHAHAQLDELSVSRDQHVRALEQARTALLVATARAEAVDEENQRTRQAAIALENELAELRGELEARTAEVETARVRLAEVENSWAKSREEADAFRALTTTGLGELLDTHRDLRGDEDRLTRGHAEKVQAVEAEAAALRAMLKDAAARLEALHAELAHERRGAREGETEQMALRSQIVGLRAQLSNALADGGRLRKEVAVRDADVRQAGKAAADAELRLGMLRNYLAENDIVLDNDGLPANASAAANAASGDAAAAAARIAELEAQLEEFTRAQDKAERELQVVARQKRDAEAQVSSMSAQLDRLRSTQSPAMSARNGDEAHGGGEARAAEAERRLEETERSFKARLQQQEDDYRLALQLVK